MEYEQIVKANESIKTTDIKGKDYAEVNQRIKAFRMVETNGAIIPEIVKLENGICVMKATILDSDGKVLAIGHAYEKEGSSFINNTSYIENCETSAVGRALGMCGFGIDTSIASYEEVANAIENQKPKKQDKPFKTEEPKIDNVNHENQKADKPSENKPLTLAEAENLLMPIGNGQSIEMKKLSIGQLEKVMNNTNPEFAKHKEAAKLILEFKANGNQG